MIRLRLTLNFFQRQALQPAGSGVIHSCFQFAGSVYSSPAKAVSSSTGRSRRAASCRRCAPCRPPSARRTGAAQCPGREFGIEDRVEKMQRAVDKFAGVHRQRAVLTLPAAVAKGQVAQAQVEVGYRPVRSLQAGVGDVQRPICREGPWLTVRKLGQRGGALQSNLVELEVIHPPAAIGAAFGIAG